MKQKIKIIEGTTTIYQGRISDIPIKEEAIIKRSIELFNDEDPCVIHQSYVIKDYVDIVLGLFKEKQTKELVLADFDTTLSFLALDNIHDCIIILEG